MFKRRNPLSIYQRWRQFIWPRTGWWRAMLYTGQRILRLRENNHAISVGLAAGAFISAFPILGTHYVGAALLAWVFRGNIIASTVGTWVGNPFTFPLIWIATFETGSFLLGRDEQLSLPPLTWDYVFNAPWDSIRPVLVPMFVGAIPIGLLLAVPTYFLGYWTIDYYQRKRALRRARLKQAREGGPSD